MKRIYVKIYLQKTVSQVSRGPWARRERARAAPLHAAATRAAPQAAFAVSAGPSCAPAVPGGRRARRPCTGQSPPDPGLPVTAPHPALGTRGRASLGVKSRWRGWAAAPARSEPAVRWTRAPGAPEAGKGGQTPAGRRSSREAAARVRRCRQHVLTPSRDKYFVFLQS